MSNFIGVAARGLNTITNSVVASNGALSQDLNRMQSDAKFWKNWALWRHGREFMYALRGANQIIDLDSVATLRGQGALEASKMA